MNSLKYFEDLKQLKPRGIKFIDDFAINFCFKKSELLKIKNIILQIINNNEKHKKFKSFNDLIKYLNNTNFYHLKRDLDLMVELEKIVVNSFKKRGIITDYIKGIEFPIGIRIVHPNLPKQLKNKLQTTSIHCDPWAGEPNDMINIVSYIHVPNLSSKLNIFKTNKKNILENSKLSKIYKSRFFIHSKYYNKEMIKFDKKESIQLNHKNGEIFLFNGFVPHNTIRNGSNVRISLEFRFRTKFPYNDISRFLSKINRRGRYWLMPNKNIKNFNHRMEDELKNLSKNKRFKQIRTLRKKEISLFNL